MQIELGLIGAVALMGVAVQLRIFHVLQQKLKDIAAEQKRRKQQDEAKAAERFLSSSSKRQNGKGNILV